MSSAPYVYSTVQYCTVTARAFSYVRMNDHKDGEAKETQILKTETVGVGNNMELISIRFMDCW